MLYLWEGDRKQVGSLSRITAGGIHGRVSTHFDGWWNGLLLYAPVTIGRNTNVLFWVCSVFSVEREESKL